MNSIYHFFRLIRIGNLIILGFTQYLIKVSLINVFIRESALTNIQFAYLVISTLCITAAGYIINDLYDLKTDMVNREKDIIIENHISTHNASIWCFILNISGLILGTIIAFAIEKELFTLIFLYCIFSLWHYSKNLKTSFLKGNLQVSFLIGLSIFNVALFDLLPATEENNDVGFSILFKIVCIYSIFAFFLTLIRELIKDIEDIEGDKIIRAKTVPIISGIKRTKHVILSLCIIVMTGIALWQYFQYSLHYSSFLLEKDDQFFTHMNIWGTDKIAIGYTILIQLLMILLIYKILKAKFKVDFQYASTLAKIIMITGILSIPLFTKIYLL